MIISSFKGIGSILVLKNGLKKNCRKNYKNNLRSNNYEVYAAVAHCFPNILDNMVLENVNLSSDKIGQSPLWSNETDSDFFHQSPTYAVSNVYFTHTFNFICTLDLKVFNFSEKITDLPFILCYELNSVHVNLLISEGDG
jgi:hypothetical protein